MAFTLNNFVGFETGGTQETDSTIGNPNIQTGVVNTGTYALELVSGETDVATILAFPGGPSDAGEQYIVGFACRFTDVTPLFAFDFFEGAGSGGQGQIGLRLDTNGDLLLRDNNIATVATASNLFTVDTFHYIEVYWQNTDPGLAEVFVDGVSVISVAAEDFFALDLDQYEFRSLSSASTGMFIDDFYCASGLTSPDERLGPSEVISYRSNLNSVTPDVGTDLDVGTWLGIQSIPFDNIPIGGQYNNTGGGSVNTDDVGGSEGTGGPDTDADITGAINGIKSICRMSRGTGPGGNHFILMGNDTDGTTQSADLDPTTSLQNFFFVSALDTVVPTPSEFQRVGIETTSNQNFQCVDVLAQVLHTPPTPPPPTVVIQAVSRAAIF